MRLTFVTPPGLFHDSARNRGVTRRANCASTGHHAMGYTLAMQTQPLSPEREAADIIQGLNRLYTELFGAESALSDAKARCIIEHWRAGDHPHWAFATRDDNGMMIAFHTLAQSFACFAGGAYGTLNELWVAPEHRSRGVGHQVIEHCREFGRARGWPRIDVTAPPDARWDRSYAFYQDQGFVGTGRKLKLLLDGD